MPQSLRTIEIAEAQEEHCRAIIPTRIMKQVVLHATLKLHLESSESTRSVRHEPSETKPREYQRNPTSLHVFSTSELASFQAD